MVRHSTSQISSLVRGSVINGPGTVRLDDPDGGEEGGADPKAEDWLVPLEEPHPMDFDDPRLALRALVELREDVHRKAAITVDHPQCPESGRLPGAKSTRRTAA